MAVDQEEGGFLTRWSRRKESVRRGEPVVPTAASAPVVEAPRAPVPALPAVGNAVAANLPPAAGTGTDPATPQPPQPTLADVAMLTRESDYAPFVARGVAPDVRHAALKKLFSDPHFNVMDGLDTYIDDYGKPDPLPEGMLRKMAQSHFLGLFSDEKPAADVAAAEVAAGAGAETGDAPDAVVLAEAPVDTVPVPATLAAPDPALPFESLDPTNEDTDLRLQRHDAAGPDGAAPGAGEDAGRQR